MFCITGFSFFFFASAITKITSGKKTKSRRELVDKKSFEKGTKVNKTTDYVPQTALQSPENKGIP